MKSLHIIRNFFGLLYPKCCEVCEDTLGKHETLLCMTCMYKMRFTDYWLTPDNPVEQIFWGREQVERACSLFFFDKGGVGRTLLHHLKYAGSREVGVILGRMLGKKLKESPLYSTVEMIVPVPLHPKKQHMRGYNQSEQIAAGIAQATDWKINTRSLARKVFTESQTKKTSAERWLNVAEAFHIKDDAIQNRHILLVDDVITTGATLEACIAQLKKVEGCRVSVATLACSI